jgi:hypothetical protein
MVLPRSGKINARPLPTYPVLQHYEGMPLSLPLGPYGLLLPVHGGCMSLGFLLSLIGMIFPRYLKRRKWWLQAHLWVAGLGAALGVAGAGAAAQMVAGSGRAHLRTPHAISGGLTVALSLAAPVLGRVMFEAQGKLGGYRTVHRWVGRAAILAMAGTIALGLLQAGWLLP